MDSATSSPYARSKHRAEGGGRRLRQFYAERARSVTFACERRLDRQLDHLSPDDREAGNLPVTLMPSKRCSVRPGARNGFPIHIDRTLSLRATFGARALPS